ncbi:hypothetical protein LSH36_1860g00009, partial [Paralvinella palmiformis]
STDYSRKGPVRKEDISIKHTVLSLTRYEVMSLRDWILLKCSVQGDKKDLGGVPLLVQLLSNNNNNSNTLKLHQVVCGALRNLSYSPVNEEIKRAIAHAAGVPTLTRLLHRTKDIRLQELITAILWNISSVKELKRSLLDECLSVLVSKILIPTCDWHLGEQVFDVDPLHAVYCSVILRNTTGILRNVSSDGQHARRKIRQCEGLVESLILIVRSASGSTEVNNICVQNSVCILRNVTYGSEEFTDPDDKKKETGKKQTADKKRGTPTCFRTKKKSSKSNDGVETSRRQVTSVGDKCMSSLWSSQLASLYLSVLYDCANAITLEAAAGAIQNLCCCDWQLSEDIRQTIRKEKGLPVLVELLTIQSDPVVCTSAAALRNLALNEQNKYLIAKHAMPQLIQSLPKKSDSAHFIISDNTLSAILTLIYNIIDRNMEAMRLFTVDGGAEVLMYIVRSDRFEYQPRMYASMILTAMWQYPDLHILYTKHGWIEQDFIVKPTPPQYVKERRRESKKYKTSKKNKLKDSDNNNKQTDNTSIRQSVITEERVTTEHMPPHDHADSQYLGYTDNKKMTSGDKYEMKHLPADIKHGYSARDSEQGRNGCTDHVTQREYTQHFNPESYNSENGGGMIPKGENQSSTQEPVYGRVTKTSYINQAFIAEVNTNSNGKDANSWV